MSTVEQEIIEKVRKLDEETQKCVLAFIEGLESSDEPPQKFYTAQDG